MVIKKEWLLLPLTKTKNSELLSRGSNSRSRFDVSSHLRRDIDEKLK